MDLTLCGTCQEPIAKHIVRAGEVISCPRDWAELPPASNYVQHVRDLIHMELPDLPPDLKDLYALLALTQGVNTTLENVHDAWAVWRNRSNPDHRSLIPFHVLSEEVQQLDAEYRDGIVRVAQRVWPAPAEGAP